MYLETYRAKPVKLSQLSARLSNLHTEQFCPGQVQCVLYTVNINISWTLYFVIKDISTLICVCVKSVLLWTFILNKVQFYTCIIDA